MQSSYTDAHDAHFSLLEKCIGFSVRQHMSGDCHEWMGSFKGRILTFFISLQTYLCLWAAQTCSEEASLNVK